MPHARLDAIAGARQDCASPRRAAMSVSKSPTQATWYFDVISPFSYLALGEIEELAQRMTVTYRPILFAALLEHWKHLGPAEIPPKRIHTYRLCVFEAQRRGIPFRFPPSHPFNPLKPLRLLAALDAAPKAVRIVMDRIWRDGLDLSLKESWDATCVALGLAPDRCCRVDQRRGDQGETSRQHRCGRSGETVRRADLTDRRRTVLGRRRAADGAGLSRRSRDLQIRRDAPGRDHGHIGRAPGRGALGSPAQAVSTSLSSARGRRLI